MSLRDLDWNVLVGTADFNMVLGLLGGPILLTLEYFLLPASLHKLLFSQVGLLLAVLSWIILVKLLAAGGVNTATANLKGKTIIVTGGAGGIGLETVRELAKMGGTVIMAARGGPTRLEAAVAEAKEGLNLSKSGGSITGMSLDLSSFASIHTFVQEFLAEHTRLHYLINNAGVMMCPYTLTEDGLEMQIGTNHFGHFLLTNLLMDTLIASKARIVNVSSSAHMFVTKLTYPRQNTKEKYDPTLAYGDSKLANIYFTQELERRYGPKGVHSYACHPGMVRTKLSRHLPSLGQTLSIPLQWLGLKTPLQGAQTQLYCALSNEAIPGEFHVDCKPWKTTKAAKDKAKALFLWEESERLTKISN